MGAASGQTIRRCWQDFHHPSSSAVSVVVLLAVEAGLALLAVLVHQGAMSVYGNVTDTALEALTWGLTAGPSGMALGVVAVVAVVGLVLSPRLWMRLTAVAIPVVLLLVMLAATPLALAQKVGKYDSSPQCVMEGTAEPMASADRESQRAFEVMPCPGGCAIWAGNEDEPAFETGTVMRPGTDICAHHF